MLKGLVDNKNNTNKGGWMVVMECRFSDTRPALLKVWDAAEARYQCF